MPAYTTRFGSLENYEKGSIEIIADDARHYAFSNIFEVATKSAPYEKVVVAKNLENVIEVLRAEGGSPWYTCAHDEFALLMDGDIEIHFYRAEDDERADEASEGTRIVNGPPRGVKMGWVRLKRGHQAILPKGSVYQYRARGVGVIMQQTISGPLSVEKWAQICYR